MAGQWTGIFSFVTGVVRYHDLAYLASVSDEMQANRVDHTYITEWDAGTWRVGDDDDDIQHWSVVAGTLVHLPLEQALFLGAGGQVICTGSGDTHEEQLPNDESAIAGRGEMRGVCAVEGVAYACGMDRQVYRRHDENDWRAMDTGARPAAEDEQIVGFETIAGFSSSEIYAAGWGGEIWAYDGKRWQPQVSPTNLVITALCCAEDGYLYACGQLGTLLRGRHTNWEVIEHGDSDDDFWSLAWFKGALYVSSSTAIYKLQNGHLQTVDFGDDEPDNCFHLSAADGVLWSIAAKDVFAFDGSLWQRID